MRRLGRWRRFVVLGFLGTAALLAACGGDDEITDEEVEHAGESVGSAAGQSGGTTIAIVGDAGELDDDTMAVADLIAGREIAAVFTVGDNEYTTEGRTVASYEESVGGVYGAFVAGGRFFPIPGDHDYGDACDDPDEPADLDAYLEYFDLPVGPEDETYYEVRIMDVHVFALDSLVDCHRDGGAKLGRQRQWLAAAATSSDAPLKIALLHNPPYSSGASHGSVEELRWEFADWGIDLVVSGDDHIYERSTHDDVVYVVNGLGGVEAHEIGDPIEGSEVLFADEFGALFVGTSPDGASVAFVTIDGEVIDEFALVGDAGVPNDDETAAGVPADVDLSADSSWTWQLLGDVDTSVDVDVYDIDLFDVPDETLASLRSDGRTVVCYFSAGSYEGWRPDAGDFDDAVLGATLDGWEDERWLDIRAPSVLAIVDARLDLAVARGCDGVEPDNVDAYANDSGFDLSAADQLAFNRAVAGAARERGLLVGLKNDLDQVSDLVDAFDFAVNEQCHEYDECDLLAPFVDDGKPVFNAEYADEYVRDPEPVCEAAIEAGVRTLVLPLDLDGSFRISCDER